MDGTDLRYILDILWIGLFLYLLYGYASLSARIRANEKSVTDHLMDIHSDMAVNSKEVKKRLKVLESYLAPVSSIKVMGGKLEFRGQDFTTFPCPPGTADPENKG